MSPLHQTTTPETVFAVSRVTATLWVIFGGAAALYGVAIVIYFGYFAEDAGASIKASVAFCGGVLVFIGQYFAREALRRLRGGQAPIVIGPAGLHDRELSERPVPWSAISSVAIRTAPRGGRFVVLEIARGAVDASGVRLAPRVEAPCNRALGYPGYRIHMLGVNADPDSLVAAMAPYVAVT
jgi:hypothetical protein